MRDRRKRRERRKRRGIQKDRLRDMSETNKRDYVREGPRLDVGGNGEEVTLRERRRHGKTGGGVQRQWGGWV